MFENQPNTLFHNHHTKILFLLYCINLKFNANFSEKTIITVFDINGIVPFLKIAHTMYMHNLIKNLFDFALVRLE